MNQIKNILVTGGSGKIGRKLLSCLVQKCFNVKAVQYQTPLQIDGITVLKGSISDPAFVAEAMKGIDAVIHLATCKEDANNFIDVSIKGTFNLLDAASRSESLQQFILASGDAALGIFFNENPMPLNENMPLKAYPGCYALSKVLEETMVNQFFYQYELPITIMRYSWIQDEDDILAYMTLEEPNFGGPAWAELVENDEQKNYFQSGQNAVGCLRHRNGNSFVRHVVSVHDVVNSLLAALGKSEAIGETFNIAAPSAFSYEALSSYIGKKLNLPVVDFYDDRFHDFSIDCSKTASILGYRPEYDIYRIVDEAIDFRKQGQQRSPVKYVG